MLCGSVSSEYLLNTSSNNVRARITESPVSVKTGDEALLISLIAGILCSFQLHILSPRNKGQTNSMEQSPS
jgi:hypothetical protein